MKALWKPCGGAYFLAALALMLGSPNASAQIKEGQPTEGGPPVISVKEGMLTYRAKNRPLKSVLEEIGDQAGVAVVMADGVKQVLRYLFGSHSVISGSISHRFRRDLDCGLTGFLPSGQSCPHIFLS
jgi:hypothetical protein